MYRQCIVCNKQIDILFTDSQNVDNSNYKFPTKDAIIFNSSGHYGTSVFDSIEVDEKIQICLCDSCAKKKTDQIIHIEKHTEIIDNSTISTFTEYLNHTTT